MKTMTFALTLLYLCATSEPLAASAKIGKTSRTTPQKGQVASQVRHITSSDDYDQVIRNARKENKKVVIKFFAHWCGACTHYERNFNDVARELKDNALFIAIDVDAPGTKEIAREFGVEFLPTTVIVDSFVGAKDVATLKQKIARAA